MHYKPQPSYTRLKIYLLNVPTPSSFISEFLLSEEKILNIIRSLNPNKAHGWDEISVRMIKLSDAALVTPLKIIFESCFRRVYFPKHGNMQM